LEKDLDTKWYNSFKELNNAIKSFVLMHMKNIISWSGKESADSAEEYYMSIIESCMKGEVPASGAGGAPASNTPAPAQAAKPAGAGGLAD